jgi:hypothetical protein
MLVGNQNHPVGSQGGRRYFSPSNPNMYGNMPLQRSFAPFSPAALIGGILILVFTFISPLPLARADDGPFREFDGSWSGNGTLRPSNGAAERIRCNASYR